MAFDNQDDTPIPDDALAQRLAALQAEAESKAQAQETAPEPAETEQEAEPADTAADDVEASDDAPEAEQALSEEDELRERVKRAHIAAREEKKRAKLLEQELEVLRGNRTETRDESIVREAQRMAQEMVSGQTQFQKTTAIKEELDKKFGGSQPILAAFAESFPEYGGVPTTLTEAVLEVGGGQEAKIIHWLSHNLDEAERIHGLSPAQQGAAVAKIAQKLSAPKPVSKAPAPVKGINRVMSGTPAQKSWDKMTQAEQIAALDAQDREEWKRKHS